MTHHFTTKRPMPSAWSAHIYGPVRGMKTSLWQQWREVAAHFRIRDWIAGSALVIFIAIVAGIMAIAFGTALSPSGSSQQAVSLASPHQSLSQGAR